MSEQRDRADCVGCQLIGRRTFLVQSGVLAAMAALAACGGDNSGTAPTLPTNSQVDVSQYPALANVGGVALVSFGGSPVAIVRTSSTAFIALSRICPHQGGTVNQSGDRWVCPVHGATFDIDGNWIGGQPTTNMHQYATTYDSTSNTLTIS